MNSNPEQTCYYCHWGTAGVPFPRAAKWLYTGRPLTSRLLQRYPSGERFTSGVYGYACRLAGRHQQAHDQCRREAEEGLWQGAGVDVRDDQDHQSAPQVSLSRVRSPHSACARGAGYRRSASQLSPEHRLSMATSAKCVKIVRAIYSTLASGGAIMPAARIYPGVYTQEGFSTITLSKSRSQTQRKGAHNGHIHSGPDR